MKKHNAVFTAAAAVFLVCLIMCLLGPSFARTINSERWSGEIHPERDITGSLIKSNLLTAGGQRILLKKSDRPYDIMITLESLSDDDMNGTLTIVNDEPDWISVSTADENITLPAHTKTGTYVTAIRLDLNYDDPEGETNSASQTGTETAAGTVTETTGAVTTTSASMAAVPDNLTFTVTFTSGNIAISGMFTISTTDYTIELQDEYDDIPSGSILRCSSWYGREHPVYIELDGAARIRYSEDGSAPGYFPPMTRYETEDQKTVLYNGGYIIANEAGTIVLDMSYANVGGQIGLHTESSDHRLDSEELPVMMAENGMVFTDGNEKLLLSKYVLDEILPDISIEYLTKDENDEYCWEETNLLMVTEDPDGAALLSAFDAPAGTYRIKMQWIYGGHLLFGIEAEIYVRYSEWQGGIST